MSTLATAHLLVDEASREHPQAFELACLASFAVRVDPPLLRRLRLELLPGHSPAIEADVWHCSLVTFRGPDGFVFAHGVGTVLRERLAAVGDQRYEQAWSVTRESHRWLSPALRLEEELNYLQSSRTSGALERARELLRSAVAGLVREESTGLAHWAAGASTRLPSDLMGMEEGRMLAMAARTRLTGSLLLASPPSGPVPEWMSWLAPEGLERIRLGVRMFPGFVELGPQREPHEQSFELPRTDPLVVEVAEVDESKLNTGSRTIHISYVHSDQQVLWWNHSIREALKKSRHRLFGGDEELKPGMPFPNRSDDPIDAVVVLTSEASLQSRHLLEEFRQALEARQRRSLPIVCVYVLPESPSEVPALARMPAELASHNWIEARPGSEQQVIRQILEAVSDSSQAATHWRRLDFRPPIPLRIPMTSDSLRLRTLLGDEYVIEPARPIGLLQVPRPVDGPPAHPREVETLLKELSGRIPLIAVTGPAGVGKTQLLRQALTRASDMFPFGCYYLEDRGAGPPLSARAVARKVVQALAPEQAWSNPDPLSLYRYLMSERRMALVLEDVDRWRWEAGSMASALSALRPPERSGAVLLLTSRRPIPGLEARWMILGALNQSEAVELLVRLAPQAGDHAHAIAETCRYLATPLYEVGAVLSRLPSSDLYIRRYAVLLRQALRLAVFPDSFDLRAAEAVLKGDEQPSKEVASSGQETLLAWEMAQVGLLQSAGPQRYVLWWPVRQVVEDLQDEPALGTASRHHASYFLNLLRSLHEQYTQGGGARAQAIAIFDVEVANIISAVDLALARSDMEVFVLNSTWQSMAAPSLIRLRIPPPLRERWFQREHKFLGSQYPFFLLEHAIALADLGQGKQAVDVCEQARARVAFPSQDAMEEAVVIKLARLQLEQGDLEAASSLMHEVRKRGLSSSARGAESRYTYSNILFLGEKRDEAEQELRMARSLAASEGDIRLEVDALLGLAWIAKERNELGRAAALNEEALEFARAWRDDRGVALASWELGLVRSRQGIRERVEELLQVFVDYARSIGHARAEQAAKEMDELLRATQGRGTMVVQHVDPPVELNVRSGSLRAAGFSPDGVRFFTAAGHSVRVWEASSGVHLGELCDASAEVFTAAFSPNGESIIIPEGKGFLSIRNSITGRITGEIHGDMDDVYAVSFSPDGKRIVTASADGSVSLYNDSGRMLAPLRGHSGAVFTARFSPSGQSIITAGEDGTVRLWDASAGSEQATLSSHTGDVLTACFSPDEQRIVTAGSDGQVILYDSKSLVPLWKREHRQTAAYTGNFSPAGRYLITGGADGTVLIWEVFSGSVVLEMRNHPTTVCAASFSPAGGQILTASLDGTVRISSAPPGL